MSVLNKTKCYLIGPMQYADGSGWRIEVERELSSMGVTVFNPYDSPFINSPKEDASIHDKLRQKLAEGKIDEVADHMKMIRRLDLSMVDKADFIVCYLNPNIPTIGTIEELVTANKSKKPVFIILEGGLTQAPFWLLGMFPVKYIYSSFSSCIEVLSKIDSGSLPIDSERWRLLLPEYR